MDAPPRPGDLTELDRERCIELLTAARFVRIAFVTDQGPSVLPVNHLVHDGSLYFRTAPGNKLGIAAADGPVAIEADGGDAATRSGWSVVVHGHASIVTDDAFAEALYERPFEPWALPDDRAFWVGVPLDTISGRSSATANAATRASG